MITMFLLRAVFYSMILRDPKPTKAPVVRHITYGGLGDEEISI